MHLLDISLSYSLHFTWFQNGTACVNRTVQLMAFNFHERIAGTVVQPCRGVVPIVQSVLQYSLYCWLEAHSVNSVVYYCAAIRFVY